MGGSWVCCLTGNFLCRTEDRRCSVIHQFQAVHTNGSDTAHHFFTDFIMQKTNSGRQRLNWPRLPVFMEMLVSTLYDVSVQ